MKTTLLILFGIILFPAHSAIGQDKMDAPSEIQAETKTPSAFVEVRYYYFPNMEAYFDTQRALYIINQNGVWTTSETIDFNSRGYCVRNGAYEMIKDYSGDEPQALLTIHRMKYPSNFSSRPTPPSKIAKPIKINNAIAVVVK